MKIWKFDLVQPVKGVSTVEMPKGAQYLQVTGATIFAIVDPAAKVVPHRFRIVMTDQEFDNTDLKYVGMYWAAPSKEAPQRAFYVFHIPDVAVPQIDVPIEDAISTELTSDDVAPSILPEAVIPTVDTTPPTVS